MVSDRSMVGHRPVARRIFDPARARDIDADSVLCVE